MVWNCAKSALSGSPDYQLVRFTNCRSVCRPFNLRPVCSDPQGRIVDCPVLFLFPAITKLWIISLLPRVERSSFFPRNASGTIFSDEDVSFSVKQFSPFPEAWPPHHSWPRSWPQQDRHRPNSPLLVPFHCRLILIPFILSSTKTHLSSATFNPLPFPLDPIAKLNNTLPTPPPLSSSFWLSPDPHSPLSLISSNPYFLRSLQQPRWPRSWTQQHPISSSTLS